MNTKYLPEVLCSLSLSHNHQLLQSTQKNLPNDLINKDSKQTVWINVNKHMLNQNTNANPNSNLAKHWNEQNIKLASFGNSTAVVAPIAANIVWAHLVIFLRLCRYESEPNGRVEKSSYFYPCNTLLWPLWLCHEHCAIITCAIKTLIKSCWYHADKTRFATLGKDHNYQWSLHWWRCKYHEAWNCDGLTKSGLRIGESPRRWQPRWFRAN